MRKYFECNIIKLVLIFCFYLYLHTSTVHAKTYLPFNLQELQTKLNIAMHSRLTTYNLSYIGDPSTIKVDVSNIINNIYDKDDYLKYTCKSYRYTALANGNIITIKFTFSYWNTLTQDMYIEKEVNKILAQIITPDMNNYEKEKEIHDWIVKNVQYDVSLTNHSDYDALIYPYKTVCQGYSLLAYKMLNKVGIPTKIIEGISKGEAHTWNLVNLDGIWYHLDITLDDPIPDLTNSINYDYYNLTDSQISVNHSWIKAYPTSKTDFSNSIRLKLTANDKNSAFYVQLFTDLGLIYLSDDYTVHDSIELKSKLLSAVKSRKNSINLRYLNSSLLSADIEYALRDIPDITSYSYSKIDYSRTTQSNDVIFKLKINYFLSPYLNSNDFPFIKPRVLAGSPINSAV
ncbi:transglutaminase domain-containing protein [Clostridium fungisolvens]|uniref:Transglutaminase-like domain-containing protein n=1 Tax=Clostridium fungisolvens TaxID=1604897 RepID=A0A6V8SI64_9CLOT|nr:transglutaminase domain-containing protein [Clostridium fungisolvens]GFP74563.1 hypothetical protein bsdtw1_00618 [Clostridium fungisolvens]